MSVFANFHDAFAVDPQPRHVGRNLVYVPLSFTLNGTNQPISAKAGDTPRPKGRGVYVERTGVGLYKVFFNYKWPVMVCGVPSVQALTGTVDFGLSVRLGVYDPTTGELVVHVADDGVAADSTNHAINLLCVFESVSRK